MSDKEIETRSCPEHGMVSVEIREVHGVQVIVYSCADKHDSPSYPKDPIPGTESRSTDR